MKKNNEASQVNSDHPKVWGNSTTAWLKIEFRLQPVQEKKTTSGRERQQQISKHTVAWFYDYNIAGFDSGSSIAFMLRPYMHHPT